MKHQTDLELDLDKIEEYGRLREDENFRFRAWLKGKDPGRIDRVVHRLNREVSTQVDCTACGNCCNEFSPAFTEADIDRIAHRLNTTPQRLKDEYAYVEDGNQYYCAQPCPFLIESKCSVYDHRPAACRSYPHLHKKGFTGRLLGIIGSYSVCPIVFNVVERLKNELNFR